MSWKDLNKQWHDVDVEYCDVCGNLLIRRYYEFATDDGKVLRACREDDERLYGLLREYAPRIEEVRGGHS